jgi:hypothetical protein
MIDIKEINANSEITPIGVIQLLAVSLKKTQTHR